jgi:hypothetical protein
VAAVDPVEIAARVAVLVARPADDPAVVEACEAAIEYVAIYTGRAEADPPLEVPSTALVRSGLVGYASRIYADQYAPNGSTSGGEMFDPVISPEDLYKHWHHYFDALAVGAPGVA